MKKNEKELESIYGTGNNLVGLLDCVDRYEHLIGLGVRVNTKNYSKPSIGSEEDEVTMEYKTGIGRNIYLRSMIDNEIKSYDSDKKVSVLCSMVTGDESKKYHTRTVGMMGIDSCITLSVYDYNQLPVRYASL